MKAVAAMMAVGLLTSVCCTSEAQVEKSRGGRVANISERYTVNAADPKNVEVVPDPAGSGQNVVKVRLRESDPKVAGGSRTEISPTKEYVREGLRWYAMSVYFPADWQFDSSMTIVSQLHTSQKATTVSPPVAFFARGRDLFMEQNFNHRRIEGEDPVNKENSTRQLIRLDRIQTERWYCFVVRADWSHTPGKGALWVWLNGERVYEAVNSHNAYETWLGNYPKSGLYVPGKMGVPERTLYVDFIHVAGPKTSFATMAAETPCAKG